MTRPKRPRRQKKSDRLTHPHSTGREIEVDYALGPLDEAARRMDRKWGVDRLPDLVSVDTAQKFAVAVAALNSAIEANDPAATAENARNMIRGYEALDREAEAAGAPKADSRVWEIDIDGMKIGIMADDTAWPAIKAKRPDLVLYTMREVGLALKAYAMAGPAMADLKAKLPQARIINITAKAPVDYAAGGDTIPF